MGKQAFAISLAAAFRDIKQTTLADVELGNGMCPNTEETCAEVERRKSALPEWREEGRPVVV